MSIKITPEGNPVLGPIAIFGIIWGAVSMIGLPIFQAFMPLSGATRRIVLLATVFVAALAGSAYSVVYARREKARLSWVDKGVHYFFLPLLFFTILWFGFCLSRE
jgi:uncharacterized membrane protein